MPNVLEGLKFFIYPVDVNPTDYKRTLDLISKAKGKHIDREERDTIYVISNFQSVIIPFNLINFFAARL
jgi:hypothetical protein